MFAHFIANGAAAPPYFGAKSPRVSLLRFLNLQRPAPTGKYTVRAAGTLLQAVDSQSKGG